MYHITRRLSSGSETQAVLSFFCLGPPAPGGALSGAMGAIQSPDIVDLPGVIQVVFDHDVDDGTGGQFFPPVGEPERLALRR